jgi:hypothetical protein
MEPQYTNNQVVSASPVTYQSSVANRRPIMLIIAIVVLLLLMILVLIFGYTSYTKMIDYKNNSDKKSAVAVAKAIQDQKKQLEADFAEQEKSPLKNYTSPSQYGSVAINYPKTWSAYIIEQATGNQSPVNGYFNPGFVPSTASDATAPFILRVQILDQPYKSIVDQFNTLVTQGKLKASTFKAENVKDSLLGIRLVGQLTQTTKGEMVIIPMRDKVLKIWTETETGRADFNNFILKNLTFSP